ncbi:MAG: hypothetical protein IJB69_10150 [Clostridia bacterium]|nr:hypothetical protein [Clostridia bacterium]
MERLFTTHHIRKTKELSGLWKFTCLDEDASSRPLQLPVPGAWETVPALRNWRGRGLYEYPFIGGGNLRFSFGGVSFRAKVMLDGREIASHYGAYTAFDAVAENVPQGEHLLQVEADNRWGDDSALHIPNDYYSYGGITRPVVMEEIPAAYITHLHITPRKTENGWEAHAEGAVCSLTDEKAEYCLSLSLDGQALSSLPVTANGKGHTPFSCTLPCPRVSPWTPENPQLYLLSATLSKDGTPLDDLVERMGFREITLSGRDILLSGKKLLLKGFNRHEDWGPFGCAVPLQAMVHDIHLMQDMGCNCVRTCHYPNDPLFLDLCDEMGILVWEESHARGLNEQHMRNPHFMEQNLLCTREMVHQHYNHPAIFIWGCLNECADDTEYGAACYRETYRTLHEADPSRPMTAALLERSGGLVYNDSDVVSVNMYPLWYYEGDVKGRMDKKFAEIDAQGAADKPFILSEIGAGAVFGYHDVLGESKWSEERQCTILRAQIEAVLSHPRCSGIFLWQFADCRVTPECAMGRPKTYNNKGVVSEHRQPKLAYKTVKELFRK